MGLLDSIRGSFLSRSSKKDQVRSIFLDENGRPKTIIATGKRKSTATPTERSDKLLKSFWNYYETDGTVFAAVNTTVFNTVMVGYNLTSNNEEAKKLVRNTLGKLNLDLVLLTNVRYALIYGDSFIEIVRNSKGNITFLKTVDPTTVIINANEFGVTENYQQKIGGVVQKTILKPEDIIHIQLFDRPSSPYGLSLILPARDALDKKRSTSDALANAIIRHGLPKYKVTVGTKDDIPPESAFTELKTELEDITDLTEIIIPNLIDISVIDEKGIPGVEEYSDIFQTELIISMLCPEEALGLGKGSTEATASVKQMMFERVIRSFQLKLSTQIEQEIIRKILDENGFDIENNPDNMVKMRYNSVTDADEAVKAKWIGNLMRGYPEGDRPFTNNEIRAMFGYGPMEESNEYNKMPTQPKEPTEQEPVDQEPENVDDNENNESNYEETER